MITTFTYRNISILIVEHRIYWICTGDFNLANPLPIMKPSIKSTCAGFVLLHSEFLSSPRL